MSLFASTPGMLLATGAIKARRRQRSDMMDLPATTRAVMNASHKTWSPDSSKKGRVKPICTGSLTGPIHNSDQTVHQAEAIPHPPNIDPMFGVASLKWESYPKDFYFGSASAAYQYEGAAKEGGRGPSIWDSFIHEYPEKIADGSNADVTIDQYHRYKEDIAIMKEMKLNAYRFSISWPRILPNGDLSILNQEGIDYYNNLINELIANGIEPFVTIFHWDVPQALQDLYGGFLSPLIVDDFRNYANVCFEQFGDRVKHWITLNEPFIFTKDGYVNGTMAPGQYSKPGTEPYKVAHHLLLAHAHVGNLYRGKYKRSQNGVIGITMATPWYIPQSDSKLDENAAQRALDFSYGWFMDPLTRGEYPANMRLLVGSRLPVFTEDEKKLLCNSYDFIGINYYSANYVADAPQLINSPPNYQTDSLTALSYVRDGKPLGPRGASPWLYTYPKGIRDLLLYTKEKYNNPVIYITENGTDEDNDPSLSVEESLLDTFRIDYHYRHLYYLKSAIDKGVKVKGYFVWSFLDDFEWSSGFTLRFGLNFVDYNDDLKRHKKLSAQWFQHFLESNL